MKNEAAALNYWSFLFVFVVVFVLVFGKAMICLPPSGGFGLLHSLTVKV